MNFYKKLRFSCALIMSMFFLNMMLTPSANAATVYCHKGKDPVTRAGTFLIKKYGTNDYAVLLGKDTKFEFINFPAGQVDNHERFASQTAARETYEETGKTLKLKSKWLSKQPHIYSKKHKILLYLVRNDKIGVRQFNANIDKLRKTKNIHRKYKEVERYYAIPVTNLIQAAKAVRAQGFPKNSHAKCYYVQTRGNPEKGTPGHTVRIERHYLNALAQHPVLLEKKLKALTKS